MSPRKSGRLMNLPKPEDTDNASNPIVNFAFCVKLAGRRGGNESQDRANIPIAKPCVYTSTRVYRGFSCFPSIASGI
jgi:hypothetical protein